MQCKVMLSIAVGAAAILFPPAAQSVWARGQAALTGTVTSEAEGKMEGVVIASATTQLVGVPEVDPLDVRHRG